MCEEIIIKERKEGKGSKRGRKGRVVKGKGREKREEKREERRERRKKREKKEERREERRRNTACYMNK